MTEGSQTNSTAFVPGNIRACKVQIGTTSTDASGRSMFPITSLGDDPRWTGSERRTQFDKMRRA